MTTSDAGIALIKKFEGFRPTVYKDAVGLPTIGYGTLLDTPEEQFFINKTLTEEDATELLRYDVFKIELTIREWIGGRVNQNQFDACVSFCYNLGTMNFRKSTLLKKILKNPNDKSIADEFKKWVYADNKKLKGLERRREAESQLYFKPVA